jgi:hypothetical protein
MTAAERRTKRERRAWDARLAAEVRRMAAELRPAAAEKPSPLKGVRRQCPA